VRPCGEECRASKTGCLFTQPILNQGEFVGRYFLGWLAMIWSLILL
jgi:hypothetical protein